LAVLGAPVEPHLPNEAALPHVFLKKGDLLTALAGELGMKTDGSVNVAALPRPCAILRPGLRRRGDRERDDARLLALPDQIGRITMKIHVAMKIKSARICQITHAACTITSLM